MITCPQCQNKEYHGALFCSECGNQLVHKDKSQADKTIYMNSLHTSPKNSQPDPHYKTVPENRFSLYIIESEQFLTEFNKTKLTIGRQTPGQVIKPDIDLSDYEAYEKGISRLHATIEFDEEQSKAHIIDMDSANGTWVNGNLIPSRSEVPIQNNDIIRLGKLKIQVVITK